VGGLPRLSRRGAVLPNRDAQFVPANMTATGRVAVDSSDRGEGAALLTEDDQHPDIPIAERGANGRRDHEFLAGRRGA
jgi:hypothetical protein